MRDAKERCRRGAEDHTPHVGHYRSEKVGFWASDSVGDSKAAHTLSACEGHVALQKKANDTNRNAYANLSRSLGCTRFLVRLSSAVLVAL